MHNILKLITQEEKAWCQVHLKSREHAGNRMQCFDQGVTNRDHSENSIFQFADPSNLGRSLLEGSKDHLLSQARSELTKREHQVGSLNNCVGDLQQQAHAQKLEL